MTDDHTLVVHKMPSGDVFYSRESDHSYWGDVTRNKDGSVKGGTDRFAGISTGSKPVDFRSDGLMNWAANLTCDGVAELMAPLLDAPDELVLDMLGPIALDGEAIRRSLLEAELTWQQLRDRAQERGTNVHERFLAALAHGKKVPSLRQATEEERGYAQGVLAFWRDHDVQAEQIEQPMCSRRHKIAGRPDLRGTVNGITSILDLKTGKFDSNADHVQVEGYELLAIESGFGASTERLILRVDEDGGYELLPSSASQVARDLDLVRRDEEGEVVCDGIAAFEATLLVYRIAGALTSLAGKRRRAKKAAA